MSRQNTYEKKVDSVIGSRVYELRLSRGISRQALATKVGVTHQQLQKYEKGINRISAGRLLAIAHALGKNVQYFFEDIDNFTPIDTRRQRLSLELTKEFNQLGDSSVQDALVMLLRNLNKRPN